MKAFGLLSRPGEPVRIRGELVLNARDISLLAREPTPYCGAPKLLLWRFLI